MNYHVCMNINCERFEFSDYGNGYCWGYAKPVDDVTECDETFGEEEENEDSD